MEYAQWRRGGTLVRILYFTDNSSDHNLRFLEEFISHGVEVVFLDATRDATAAKPLPAGIQIVRFQRCLPGDAGPSQYEGVVAELKSL